MFQHISASWPIEQPWDIVIECFIFIKTWGDQTAHDICSKAEWFNACENVDQSVFVFTNSAKNKLKKVLIRCNCEHQKQIKTAVKEQNSYKLL